MKRTALLLLFVPLLPLFAGEQPDLADKLSRLEARVFPANSAEAKDLARMLGKHFSARRDTINQNDRKAWLEVKNKADWERFREARLQALRASLGQWPEAPKQVPVHVSKTLAGDGFKVLNLVFESRPGLFVTANLYEPDPPREKMPGIILSHSHHSPRTQGELQDMGMTWARQGCLVLVPDHLGHGERRQHPFQDAKSFPGAFKVGRQDYYGRYNIANQLHVAGESLMGWMVWDLMRGVDVLLARQGIDRDKIAVLGAVAGGGDPAAVTGALDTRIAAVGPFNFGGPQPETVFPLPADAETSFNYLGGGSWESTRNLRNSGRDGFLPWVIVGAVAPRGLIYGHEFAWDKERDPVWKRLETIYGWYGQADKLAFATGKGKLSGQPPESTHCNNIGPEHRKPIHATFERWFGIAQPKPEYQKRFSADELRAWTPELAAKLKPRLVHEVAGQWAAERSAAFRKQLSGKTPDRLKQLADAWEKLLGNVQPPASAVAKDGAVNGDGFSHAAEILKIEGNITVPVLKLLPKNFGMDSKSKYPVVVAFAQEGRERFIKEHSQAIAALLEAGVMVCLPDLRGCGETRPGDGRGRTSGATSHSSTGLMVGDPLLAGRLRDLRALLANLRKSPFVDSQRIALWGDSFAPVNGPDVRLDVPFDADKQPVQAEPLGDLLVLLAGLYEPDLKALYARGGLSNFRTIFHSPFNYLPHDAFLPGAAALGDLDDITTALAPRPVRLEGLVDGQNRRIAGSEPRAPRETARWLVEQLKK